MNKLTYNGFLAVLTLAAALGAGCTGIENDPDALYKLAGGWYDSRYHFSFEITEEGQGYIAGSTTQYKVLVSSNYVSFRDSHDTVIGSFHYELKKGELTMTSGSWDFKDMKDASPFIKRGAIPSGAKVPVELIGTWNRVKSPDYTAFTITPSGIITISGMIEDYMMEVEGNVVSVLLEAVFQGKFTYIVEEDGKIAVRNGTELCRGLDILSPFFKKAVQ
ncbi:MAG: hypothetical protein LBG76_06975 [Treponema sp.]|jgi:hypothetical protein|nr:hypothetical protein [Treponema sp.]